MEMIQPFRRLSFCGASAMQASASVSDILQGPSTELPQSFRHADRGFGQGVGVNEN